MRIAPEGWPFILAFWALELVLYAFAPLWAALLWLPVAVWVIAFFRDGLDIIWSPLGFKIGHHIFHFIITNKRTVDTLNFSARFHEKHITATQELFCPLFT